MTFQSLRYGSWSSVVVVKALTTIGMGIALGMVGLGALAMLNARSDAWRQAEQAGSNLAHALERDIARNITTLDLSLQGAIDALRQPGIDTASPGIRHMALFNRAGTAEYLGSLLVLDAEGKVTASTKPLGQSALDLTDRDYFQVHQEHPDAGLFLSRPFQSRLRSGDPSIALSRRVTGQDGRFEGVVMSALRLAYFGDLFSKLDLGSKGSVSLFRTDGILMARFPSREADFNRDLGGAETFRQFAAAPSGSFVGTAALDGVERFYTFRRVKDLPLILSVAVATSDVQATWWAKVWALGLILVVLCAATVVLCLLFRREMLRRIAAESALQSAVGQLSVMAATDGLTGLVNRRQFDATLEQEWRRAIRSGTPISLLLLDADFFKSYNDGYGHLAGDEVLRSIASCLQLVLRRPADTGARYGGEEFVAILPDTDAAGAWNTAERVRSAVAALEIPHAASLVGRVTVSIGVATAYPQAEQKAAVLIREADEALYEAKRNGRNRVHAVGPVVLQVA
jgi:diguanylate cyclase (GGDEF)-like protein